MKRIKMVLFGSIIFAGFLFILPAFAVEADDIIVSGVMYDESSAASRAIVNGAIVGVGDKIGDIEIVAIKSTGIVVKNGGQEQEVEINNLGALAPQSSAKAKSGFWAGLMEKISSLGRKKTASPSTSGVQNHYLKATSFYQEAQASRDNKERVEFYQDAVKYAQYSLDIELPDPAKTEELKNIIEDSRRQVSKFSEKLKSAKEMDRLFMEGRKYAEAAWSLSSSEPTARAKRKENYSLALQYFRQAYNLAADAYDKRRIEDKISDVEASLEALN